MKKIIAKLVVMIFGILSIVGISISHSNAFTQQEQRFSRISETTPLYLMHAKNVFSKNVSDINQHNSHWSHGSHGSHGSHDSHSSHYSSRW